VKRARCHRFVIDRSPATAARSYALKRMRKEIESRPILTLTVWGAGYKAADIRVFEVLVRFIDSGAPTP